MKFRKTRHNIVLIFILLFTSNQIKSNQVFKLDNARSGSPEPDYVLSVRAFRVELEFRSAGF